MNNPRVKGYCPMGCGQTLFLGNGGYVTCSLVGCPDPSRADSLLAERETEHIVQFSAQRFTVLHPRRERREDLFDCKVSAYFSTFDRPPVYPGRYRASWTDEAQTDLHLVSLGGS